MDVSPLESESWCRFWSEGKKEGGNRPVCGWVGLGGVRFATEAHRLHTAPLFRSVTNWVPGVRSSLAPPLSRFPAVSRDIIPVTHVKHRPRISAWKLDFANRVIHTVVAFNRNIWRPVCHIANMALRLLTPPCSPWKLAHFKSVIPLRGSRTLESKTLFAKFLPAENAAPCVEMFQNLNGSAWT